MRSVLLLSVLVLLLTPGSSSASLCDHYKEKQAAIHYRLICMEKSTEKSAGASSTLSASFGMNATALPTEPNSYGLEVIGNYARHSGKIGPVFALVKGFTRFGTGISTAGNNTFYGDDVIQRESGAPEVDNFEPNEPAKGKAPNLNFGTAFSMINFSEDSAIKLGTSIRYNKTTSTWGGGPALSFTSPFLTLGVATTQERVSNLIGPVRFITVQGSLRLAIFEFEHAYLKNNSSYHQAAIRIYTLSATIHKLIIAGATRSLLYYTPGADSFPVQQKYLAIQFLFTKTFSAGVLYNYVPGSTSIGMQAYL